MLEVEQDINKEVEKYNTYVDTGEMKVLVKDDFASLFIDNELITEDFDFVVLERIRQINHENGLDYF
jgi:hypothetical protein